METIQKFVEIDDNKLKIFLSGNRENDVVEHFYFVMEQIAKTAVFAIVKNIDDMYDIITDQFCIYMQRPKYQVLPPDTRQIADWIKPDPISGYLQRSLVHRALQHVKSKSKSVGSSFELMEDDFELIYEQQETEEIDHAINEMAKKIRNFQNNHKNSDILNDFYYNNLTQQQIADKYGFKSVGAVKSTLHRAKSEMVEILKIDIESLKEIGINPEQNFTDKEIQVLQAVYENSIEHDENGDFLTDELEIQGMTRSAISGTLSSLQFKGCVVMYDGECYYSGRITSKGIHIKGITNTR
jgi:DNA-directed RNA polymerase specialized sigma24 family protein